MPEEEQIYSTAKTAEAASYINDLALHTAAGSLAVTAAFTGLACKYATSNHVIVFGVGTAVLLAVTAYNAWHTHHYSRRQRPETYQRASYRCREAFVRKLAGPVIAIATVGASAFCPPEDLSYERIQPKARYETSGAREVVVLRRRTRATSIAHR